MRLSPLLLVSAAAAVTFGAGQAALPTAHAQDLKQDLKPVPAACRAAVKSLRLTRTAHGVEVVGELLNTGPQPLVYSSVLLTLRADAQPAYLTSGPVRPGQSAEFRAVLPATLPAVSAADVSVRLREAGQAVAVEQMPKVQAAKTAQRAG